MQLPRDLGPYRLVEKLGAGGMGVVYRAIDTKLDRPVAIKMMLGGASMGQGADAVEIRERFLREARAAARINSRHVAGVMQLGATDDAQQGDAPRLEGVRRTPPAPARRPHREPNQPRHASGA